MADIFISYSRKDTELALTLTEKLTGEGYSVWIDQGGIYGASNWSSEIVEAINSCSTVVFLISHDSVSSDNVAREIHLASEKKKHLLPVVITEVTLPVIFEYPLAGIQRVRYDDTNAILRALIYLMKAPSVMEQMKPVHTQAREDDGFIHLAVLPFDDLSPQGDNQWFADGMLDELIGTLGALRKLRVPSRSDVLFFKKHHMKTREVADDLGVRYLVEGSVRKAGNKIRISASLIDSNSNNVIWTNKFDGSFDDIFDFQDTVAHEIVTALKLQLTPEEEQKVVADPTKNAEAYELYLKAIEHQRRYTREGYENSIVLLDEALELDDRFTDAYIGKSYAFATYYREYSRDPKWLRYAEEAIELAEQVSLVTASTLRARAEIAMLRSDNAEAEKLLKTAIYEEPTYKELYNLLGNIYISSGRYDEAREAFAKALSIKEDVAGYQNLMVVLSYQNDLIKRKEIAEAAIAYCSKQLRRAPDVIFVKFVYVYSLYCAQRNEEALGVAEELLADQRLDATMLYNLGIIFEHLGDIPRNFQLLERAVYKGFRQIEALRNLKYDDAFYSERLKELIAKLEELIKAEQVG